MLSYAVAAQDVSPLARRGHEQVSVRKRKSTRATVLTLSSLILFLINGRLFY